MTLASEEANNIIITVASSNSKGGGFWKKPSSAIPGRPNLSKSATAIADTDPVVVAKSTQNHAPLTKTKSYDMAVVANVSPTSATSASSAASSFRVFEQSVSDAWDIKESEDPDQPQKVATSEPAHTGKRERVEALVASSSIEIEDLRRMSWPGLPARSRAKAWKILCGYLPGNSSRQSEIMARKKDEYGRYVDQYFGTRNDDVHADTYRQIAIDIPRMSPVIGLFQQRCVQEIFERILFIWAIRHPASGYVQGINDLVTPFFLVFLRDAVGDDVEVVDDVVVPADLDVAALPENVRNAVEADSFWCLSVVLDGIQDNYTFAQPGIQNKLKQLENLVERIDADLHRHLVSNDVAYLQFAFRWMNNLLMRELPVKATIRLWDTYLSQADGFSHFHLYVCAAFLIRWKSELMKRNDFHTILMFLQNLPTAKWADEDVNLLVAEAYRLSYLFADAPSHLVKK